MQQRQFPCAVYFVYYSHTMLTSAHRSWPLIEKAEAIKETEKSLTTINRRGHKPYTTCHHKRVMKDNSQWFFYDEAEAKEFLRQKLQAKREELEHAIASTRKNDERWTTEK